MIIVYLIIEFNFPYFYLELEEWSTLYSTFFLDDLYCYILNKYYSNLFTAVECMFFCILVSIVLLEYNIICSKLSHTVDCWVLKYKQATRVKYPDYQVSGQKYVCTYKKNIMYFPADNFFGHFSLLFVKSGIADTMCFDDIFSTSVHLH